MQIEIKPEDIDRLVKEALLKSSIGKAVADAMADIFKSDRWDNPFKQALNRQARMLIAEMMREPEIMEPLKAAIRKKFAEMVEGDVIEAAAKAMVTRMIQNNT